jgi:lysophospholipase L1-like esterase
MADQITVPMRIAFFGDSLTSGIPGSSYVSIMRRRLPGYTLVNLGKGNDTAVSLHRRVAAMRFDGPFDLAFLWVGVNDVFGHSVWVHRTFNTLMGQRRSRDLGEFRACYRATLDLLCQHAGRVVAVSPLVRGEDPDNRWNRGLTVLSGAVEELASRYGQVEFLDLRPAFFQVLADSPPSGYVPRGPHRVVLDALTLCSDEQVDRMATRRGLRLTLDGLHLNSAGARLAADAFVRVIETRGSDPQSARRWEFSSRTLSSSAGTG